MKNNSIGVLVTVFMLTAICLTLCGIVMRSVPTDPIQTAVPVTTAPLVEFNYFSIEPAQLIADPAGFYPEGVESCEFDKEILCFRISLPGRYGDGVPQPVVIKWYLNSDFLLLHCEYIGENSAMGCIVSSYPSLEEWAIACDEPHTICPLP